MGPARVLLLRHGNTGKAAVDAARQLTDKGKAQCLRLSERYASKFRGIEQCFSSSALRALETARLVTGSHDIVTLDPLYFEPRTEAMRATDKELGYAPLSAYSKHADFYEPWVQRAASSVREAWKGESSILLVGHHSYISLLARRLLVDEWVKSQSGDNKIFVETGCSLIEEVNLGEACGFELDGIEGAVRHLECPVTTDFTKMAANDDFIQADGTSSRSE